MTRKQVIKRFVKKHWKQILLVIYIISPIDILPEFLFPFFGFGDDLLALITLFYSLYKDLKNPPEEENSLDNSSKNDEIMEGEIVE